MQIPKPPKPASVDRRRRTARVGAAAKKPVDRAQLDPSLQDHIGLQLQTFYNAIVEEPVPDRFLKLLGALEGERKEEP